MQRISYSPPTLTAVYLGGLQILAPHHTHMQQRPHHRLVTLFDEQVPPHCLPAVELIRHCILVAFFRYGQLGVHVQHFWVQPLDPVVYEYIRVQCMGTVYGYGV